MQQTLEMASNQEYKNKLPEFEDRLSEELVIALVGPISSGCTTTAEEIERILENEFGYTAYRYKLSDIIRSDSNRTNTKTAGNLSFSDGVSALQKAGDELREKFGNGYLASKVVEKISKTRHEKDGFQDSGEKGSQGDRVAKKHRWVHIIDSIKHPDELKILKQTYGEIFWLFGVFAPMQIRKERLKDVEVSDVDAAQIITRDYSEADKYGQKVKDVFHQSDFFIRNDSQSKEILSADIQRFLAVMFGSPSRTPTKDESSMYSAYAEACRSACLSRQVGAAVVNSSGDLIGLGRNDVPRVDGGLYEATDKKDSRCYAWKNGQCHNDSRKDKLYGDIYKQLESRGLLKSNSEQNQVIEAVKSTDVKALIEYSRAVHAEMDAIISIARTNKPGLMGAVLYCTTYPCHSCARHIVASGIKKVFFIEPYPKSLALELHSDSIDSSNDKGKVQFLQYMGVAPKNMLKLFKVEKGRKASGKIEPFDKKKSKPVVRVSLDDYTMHEKLVVARLQQELDG
ncbi:anti-phage dCTP deaminase [Idiomarina sp. HP20-50]|uniref:anti-phage dCTP deaminase n=1 Tax=Idiomarina sp. HP20-50 TaxID=3070813 RepID=UPI00294AD1FF|nr:anti-phage dCTP deaminase [Idiomarina sp. HP20-50]MDV6316255.1 anti-phage dCTP deaminase [Idiomarina sp. HP20-50]